MKLRTIKTIITIISILFLLWVGISWIDIIADNTQSNPYHYPWNFFVVYIQVMDAMGGAR